MLKKLIIAGKLTHTPDALKCYRIAPKIKQAVFNLFCFFLIKIQRNIKGGKMLEEQNFQQTTKEQVKKQKTIGTLAKKISKLQKELAGLYAKIEKKEKELVSLKEELKNIL